MNELRSHAPSAGTPSLRLDWCSHEAAKFAVEHWHYSRRMPKNKLVKVGVWEGEHFVGVVIFSPGGSPDLGSPYGLSAFQTCELTRIALARHEAPVSRVVRFALRLLKQRSPGIRLVVSFADPKAGHVGGIYQAGNWVYTGMSSPSRVYYDRAGVAHHSRNVKTRSYRDRHGVVNHARSLMVREEELPGKHRYLMPLDDEMRDKIRPLAKPYPKRERSAGSGTPDHQSGGGGANPTRSLETVA